MPGLEILVPAKVKSSHQHDAREMHEIARKFKQTRETGGMRLELERALQLPHGKRTVDSRLCDTTRCSFVALDLGILEKGAATNLVTWAKSHYFLMQPINEQKKLPRGTPNIQQDTLTAGASHAVLLVPQNQTVRSQEQKSAQVQRPVPCLNLPGLVALKPFCLEASAVARYFHSSLPLETELFQIWKVESDSLWEPYRVWRTQVEQRLDSVCNEWVSGTAGLSLTITSLHFFAPFQMASALSP